MKGFTKCLPSYAAFLVYEPSFVTVFTIIRELTPRVFSFALLSPFLSLHRWESFKILLLFGLFDVNSQSVLKTGRGKFKSFYYFMNFRARGVTFPGSFIYNINKERLMARPSLVFLLRSNVFPFQSELPSCFLRCSWKMTSNIASGERKRTFWYFKGLFKRRERPSSFRISKILDNFCDDYQHSNSIPNQIPQTNFLIFLLETFLHRHSSELLISCERLIFILMPYSRI